MKEFTVETIDRIEVVVNVTGCHLVLEYRNADNYAETLHFDSIAAGKIYDALTADREYQHKQTKTHLQSSFELSKMGQLFSDDVEHKEVGTNNYTFREVTVAFRGYITGLGYDFEQVEGW